LHIFPSCMQVPFSPEIKRFSGVSKHLYNSLRPSIGPSVPISL
jgi:hypothetical protein